MDRRSNQSLGLFSEMADGTQKSSWVLWCLVKDIMEDTDEQPHEKPLGQVQNFTRWGKFHIPETGVTDLFLIRTQTASPSQLSRGVMLACKLPVT